MKTIFYVSLAWLCSFASVVHAKIKLDAVTMTVDTTIQPGKEQITKSLVNLRDSIDNSILSFQKKRDGNSGSNSYKQNSANAYDGLTLLRLEVEKVLEEVVTSNERTWDENIRTRALEQLALRRKEYQDILGSVKQAGKKP